MHLSAALETSQTEKKSFKSIIKISYFWYFVFFSLIFLLELFSQFVVRIPNLSFALLYFVFFSTYYSGLGSGLSCSLAMIVYHAWYLSPEGLPFQLDESNQANWIGTFFAAPILAATADWLTQNSRSIEEESKRELDALHKHYAAMIQSTEQRYRAIIDMASEGILTINTQGQVLYFNRAAENLFGYVNFEVIGKNVKILMPEPYCTEHDDYLKNYLSSGNAKIIGIGREVIGLRRDGSTFSLHLSVGEAQLEGERIFIGVARDLSQH